MDFFELLAQAKHAKVLDGFRAPLLTGGIALAVSWAITPFVRRFAIQKGAVDDPEADERRVHDQPTPRWGGLAIYSGIVVSLLIALPLTHPRAPFPLYLIGVLLIGALVVVYGAYDDLHQFRPRVQLLFLLAIGLAVQFIFDPIGRVQISGIETPLFGSDGKWQSFGWVAVPITAFYIFVVTKTMDTIDGLDGLAAGIAAIAATTLSIIATYEEQPRVALVTAAVAGSAIGFLRHNYNPAKIFMGTGGAQLLGFLLASLSIVGAMKTAAALAIFIPLLVFAVPMFDAGFVVVRRLLSRQPITQADKRHLHHTLLSKGLNQRQAVWVLYLAAIVLSGVLLAIVRLHGTT